MKKLKGFTLPEILIALAMAIILLMIAIPSFQHFREQQRIRYISQALTHSIAYARLQAVLRYQTMLITEKNNDWKNGWVITTTSKQILRDFPPMPLDISLIIFQKKHKFLKINPQGMTEGYNGHFEYGDLWLVFNRGGRTYTKKARE